VRRNHRDLDAWKEAMGLAESVYHSTRGYPVAERYGLTAQMRRAAISVPANIAEGFARRSSKELLQFLSIAAGSLSELDTLVELSSRLGLLEDVAELSRRVDRTSGLVMGLAASIERRVR